jgi:hypothetical protein
MGRLAAAATGHPAAAAPAASDAPATTPVADPSVTPGVDVGAGAASPGPAHPVTSPGARATTAPVRQRRASTQGIPAAGRVGGFFQRLTSRASR